MDQNARIAKKFICPECGGERSNCRVFANVAVPTDPWTQHPAQMRIECEECELLIPIHLAERWEDVTLEEARRQWNEIYKPIGHQIQAEHQRLTSRYRHLRK